MNSFCTVITVWVECFPEKSSWCLDDLGVPGDKMKSTLSDPNRLDIAVHIFFIHIMHFVIFMQIPLISDYNFLSFLPFSWSRM